jgi:hypothetical protein
VTDDEARAIPPTEGPKRQAKRAGLTDRLTFDEYADRIVASWPLTEEQLGRLAALVRVDPASTASASGASNARELSVPRRTITP